MTSTVFSAQFENLGELVKNLIFPVGVDTFPTELSGRLRHVFSPAGAGPEKMCIRDRGLPLHPRSREMRHFRQCVTDLVKQT